MIAVDVDVAQLALSEPAVHKYAAENRESRTGVHRDILAAAAEHAFIIIQLPLPSPPQKNQQLIVVQTRIHQNICPRAATIYNCCLRGERLSEHPPVQ